MFDGRLAEDFKLLSGTWVRVGQVRTGLISASGVLLDAVIAGHDRDYVAALAWVQPGEAASCGSSDVALDDPELARHLPAELQPRVRGSASRVERLFLLAEGAGPGRRGDHRQGVHQPARRARAPHRAVARLFAEPPDPAVIVASG